MRLQTIPCYAASNPNSTLIRLLIQFPKLRSIWKDATAAVSFLCTIVCWNSCSPPPSSAEKSVFHWNIHSGITSLDPAFARNQSNIWLCNQIYDGLVALNDSLQPVPALARRWEMDSSGRIYTFYLRTDVYFHADSLFENPRQRRVTASDVVYSFNRILDPKLASPGAWIFNNQVAPYDTALKGSPAFRALNDSTFQLTLNRPFPPLLGLLSMQYCNVVPREVAEHYGKDFGRHPVGCGPFRMAFWQEGSQLVLHAHPQYYQYDAHGNRLPYLDAVDVTFIPSKQNEFLAFLNGELDFLSGIDASFKDHLLTADGQLRPRWQGRFRIEKIPFLNTEYLGFLLDPDQMSKTHPLRDVRVRKAINYGFDRAKMLRYLRNGIGRPGHYGMVPPGLPAFDSSRFYDYQPRRARRLLREAGYPKGAGMPTIPLHTNSGYLDLCLFVQKELARLGIPLEVKVHPPATLREWVAQGKLGFFRASWIADYPDAENYLSLFYSANHAPEGPNYTRFRKASADALYQKALRTSSPEDRERIYHAMEAAVMEKAPVVVLYYDEVVRLIPPDVTGLSRNAVNLIDLSRVRKTDKGSPG